MCAGYRPGHERLSARSRMWATLRRRRTVTAPYLETVCGASYAGVLDYMRALVRCGYAVVTARPRPSRPASAMTWRLVRDTGPKTPRWRGTASIYDPNLGRVVGPGEGR